MNIAFTLCSNNYLAQAKTLGDSFKKHHPDFEFIIGLVDDYSKEIDYQEFKEFTLIKAEEINIPDFIGLQEKFNIVELNTAVKPFYFSYLFNVRNAKKIIYLDPDILVFSRFDEVIELLDDYNIIITPQLCAPIDDDHYPTDLTQIITGTFNLGFIALSDKIKVNEFLNWWSARVVRYGFALPSNHMFYDQLIINLVPAYFDNYFILRHKGYNMAGWNLFERKVTKFAADETIINEDVRLRFFHFSGYKFSDPERICIYNDRYDFLTRPDVKGIFSLYHNLVMENKYDFYSRIWPVYKKAPAPHREPSFYEKVRFRLRRTARVFLGME